MISTPETGFDPGVAGTPDTAWRAALSGCAAWAPRAGSLVLVSPHPDDETLGAGGLLHGWARLGHRTVVISVTDGEAAYDSWPRLDEVRRRELGAALDILGRGALQLIRLGIPDGRAKLHAARIRAAIEATVDRDTTLICPYEHDGHPDHEATALSCLDVARRRGLPVARYPVWMWHQSAPAALEGLRCGRFWLDRASQTIKSRAVACYVSQTSPPRRAPIIPAHVLGYFARPYEVFLV